MVALRQAICLSSLFIGLISACDRPSDKAEAVPTAATTAPAAPAPPEKESLLQKQINERVAASKRALETVADGKAGEKALTILSVEYHKNRLFMYRHKLDPFENPPNKDGKHKLDDETAKVVQPLVDVHRKISNHSVAMACDGMACMGGVFEQTPERDELRELKMDALRRKAEALDAQRNADIDAGSSDAQ